MTGKSWLGLLTAFFLAAGCVPAAAADEAGAPEGAETAEAAATVLEEETSLPAAALGGSARCAVGETSAVSLLLLDTATGTVILQEEPHLQREPASVTKVMTMLLVCEALESGALTEEDVITVSSHAASMGGSQVYLEEGEEMTVRDLLKAVAVSSGNDAAVALAEAVSGSEAAFVERMNLRAEELGMGDTHFVNCTGLPAPGHVTSAWDIGVMSRMLLAHDRIKEYTTIWMDSLRDGEFGLSSTNRLIYSYPGATGLKTGYTDSAGFCISASACREGMELVAVVLGAETSADRFGTAATLLDYGFANYTLMTFTPQTPPGPVPVTLGTADRVAVTTPSVRLLVPVGEAASARTQVELEPSVEAPVAAGDALGTFTVYLGQTPAVRLPITAAQSVERLTLGRVFSSLFRILLGERN